MSQLPNTIWGLTQFEKLSATKEFSASNAFLKVANVPADFQLPANNAIHRQHMRDLQSGTVATRRAPLFIAYQDGTITLARAVITQTAAVGGATLSIDILKNGSTILSAPIAMSSSTALRTAVTGTLSSAAVAAGDVFEVSVTATTGGGTLPVGLITELIFDEEPN